MQLRFAVARLVMFTEFGEHLQREGMRIDDGQSEDLNCSVIVTTKGSQPYFEVSS